MTRGKKGSIIPESWLEKEKTKKINTDRVIRRGERREDKLSLYYC